MKKPDPAASPPPPSDPGGPLTSAQFHILLTLAEGQRHGYGIMQEILRRTEGVTELGPGTLYRSIKQLLDRGLIEEVEGPDESDPDPGRPRRSYALTGVGRSRAADEARRLADLVEWARESMVVEGGG